MLLPTPTRRRASAPGRPALDCRKALTLPWRVLQRAVAKGPAGTLRRAGFLAYEAFRDWRLGIDTDGFIHWYELGNDPESVDYDPIGYRTLDRALRRIAPPPDHDVFLDYGCGKGRVLLTAATMGFAKAIGVEMSAQLCEAARANLRQARRHLACRCVEIVCCDAKTYNVPDDVTVIFLFNPFTGTALRSVVDQIHQSLQRQSRSLKILYVIPVHSPDILAECAWLRKTHEQPSQGLQLVVYEARLSATTKEVRSGAP